VAETPRRFLLDWTYWQWQRVSELTSRLSEKTHVGVACRAMTCSIRENLLSDVMRCTVRHATAAVSFNLKFVLLRSTFQGFHSCYDSFPFPLPPWPYFLSPQVFTHKVAPAMRSARSRHSPHLSNRLPLLVDQARLLERGKLSRNRHRSIRSRHPW
jgi:hypothetical protein